MVLASEGGQGLVLVWMGLVVICLFIDFLLCEQTMKESKMIRRDSPVRETVFSLATPVEQTYITFGA